MPEKGKKKSSNIYLKKKKKNFIYLVHRRMNSHEQTHVKKANART